MNVRNARGVCRTSGRWREERGRCVGGCGVHGMDKMDKMDLMDLMDLMDAMDAMDAMVPLG